MTGPKGNLIGKQLILFPENPNFSRGGDLLYSWKFIKPLCNGG